MFDTLLSSAFSKLASATFMIAVAIHSAALADINSSDQWLQERPDGHAPIGVMGDHTHTEGEFMFSYRYMAMDMEGNRSGKSRVSPSEVLQDYMVSPTRMEMKMHMFGGMYAPSDTITLMAMLPLLELSMDHVTRMGSEFSTRTSGLGDIQISALWKIVEERSHQVHINAGISLPTGNIKERGNTPAGADMKLTYPMQLGSGTFDLRPGITYNGKTTRVSWGAQSLGTLRLGENGEDYTLGDRIEASVWGAVLLSDWLSGSLRGRWHSWDDISGNDSELNPMMVPTAVPTLRGGEIYELGLGFNLLVPNGSLEGLRLAFEVLYPIDQHLDGPQLETDLTYTFGIQRSF